MGPKPKNKAAGGKGKKLKAGGEFAPSIEEQNMYLEVQKEALIGKLIRVSENGDKCKASEGEKRLKEL